MLFIVKLFAVSLQSPSFLPTYAETNIEVVKKFVDVDVRVASESERVCIVEVVKAR
jgi:RNA 3'-terminal phosphate cyclase